MEDTKDDLGTKVDELPNHAEEFNADCLSQTTGTNWSVGLTFDDPFAVQLATQFEVNECRRSTRSMGRSLKESKRKICSVLMMSCMVKKMGGGVCRRGTCLHHAGEIKVVHKEN